jgi:hypothetical protein
MKKAPTRTNALRMLGALALILAFDDVTARAEATSDTSLNPLATTLEKAKLRSFLEAPLFDPSRRLPPVEAPIVAPPPPPPIVRVEPPPRVHLLGVIQGKPTVAFVKLGDDARTMTLQGGDHLSDWAVTILPASIRLRNGSRAFDYALFSKGGMAAGPVPVDERTLQTQEQPRQ